MEDREMTSISNRHNYFQLCQGKFCIYIAKEIWNPSIKDANWIASGIQFSGIQIDILSASR